MENRFSIEIYGDKIVVMRFRDKRKALENLEKVIIRWGR